MPVFIAWLWGALETRIGAIIISALLTLGLSFASYKFAVEPLRNLIQQQLAESGAEFTSILGFLGVDAAITMVLSAYTTRWAVSTGLNIIRKK